MAARPHGWPGLAAANVTHVKLGCSIDPTAPRGVEWGAGGGGGVQPEPEHEALGPTNVTSFGLLVPSKQDATPGMARPQAEADGQPGQPGHHFPELMSRLLPQQSVKACSKVGHTLA